MPAKPKIPTRPQALMLAEIWSGLANDRVLIDQDPKAFVNPTMRSVLKKGWAAADLETTVIDHRVKGQSFWPATVTSEGFRALKRYLHYRLTNKREV